MTAHNKCQTMKYNIKIRKECENEVPWLFKVSAEAIKNWYASLAPAKEQKRFS